MPSRLVLLYPNSQLGSGRASAFPGEKGPLHPTKGKVWEMRCPVSWATEPSKGHNAGDTLSSDSSRWLHGGGLCGGVGGGTSGYLDSSQAAAQWERDEPVLPWLGVLGGVRPPHQGAAGMGGRLAAHPG